MRVRTDMHRFLLHNDDIRDAAEHELAAGQVGLLSGWGVFSTLRVYDGVMFAWERHWERMRRDAERMHVPFPADSRWLEAKLQQLIAVNAAWNATLRVVVVRNRGGLYEGPGLTRDFDVIAFTVDMVRWPETVKLGLIPHGRHAASEFAGTKYLSWAENLTRYERAHDRGLDEVVLLNERGEVSECTSANIFAVDAGGGRVWTPPLASGCLAGVTRAVLLEEVRVAGIGIGEKTLLPEDLTAANEIFVTSTTRELLPVSSIEGLNIKGRGAIKSPAAIQSPAAIKSPAAGPPICGLLRAAFSERVKSYINPRRKPVYN
jgi:branched-chain amino acid aminotransferase